MPYLFRTVFPKQFFYVNAAFNQREHKQTLIPDIKIFFYIFSLYYRKSSSHTESKKLILSYKSEIEKRKLIDVSEFEIEIPSVSG